MQSMTCSGLALFIALGSLMAIAAPNGALAQTTATNDSSEQSASTGSRLRWRPNADQGEAKGTLSGGRRGNEPGSDRTQRWRPKQDQGNVQGTLSGGRRGEGDAACSHDADATQLTLLAPEGRASLLTEQSQPTLMWQVLSSQATTAEFILSNVTQANPVYTTTQAIEGSGFMQVTLPESAALEPGEQYRWTVIVQCPDGGAVEIYARSFIKRLDGESLNQVNAETATASAQSNLDLALDYAEQGVWYDALAYAYWAQQANPSDRDSVNIFYALLDQGLAAD